MPDCGSQVTLCNLPVRFDTYQGCTHGCKYCFAYRKNDIKDVRKRESAESLKKFVRGERTIETNWCDWNIPLHWGGLSDPFQPAELKYGRSFKCLQVFAESKYPFVVSTKSTLTLQEPYYSLLKECNFVFQVSMLSPAYDKIEPGAPPFAERLRMIEPMAKVAKRVIIRLQPYIPAYHADIISYFKDYRNAGAYGVVAEAIKYQRKIKGTIKLQGDFVYPLSTLKPNFQDLKSKAHKNNLAFFSGENRLRAMGDSLTCCGTEGLRGFRDNKANLNQYLYDRNNFRFTKAQRTPGTATCFKAMSQRTVGGDVMQSAPYKELMLACTRDRGKIDALRPIQTRPLYRSL